MSEQVNDKWTAESKRELAEARGNEYRLAVLIDDWRFPVRDEFRKAAKNLLARYLGGQAGIVDTEADVLANRKEQ